MMTKADDDLTALARDILNKAAPASTNGTTPDDQLPVPVDWSALFTREAQAEEWLVDDFWPARRAISIVARYKSGKSLLLFYMCACLARGIDPWTSAPREPITVGYWDMEMTEDDLHDRALDFGLEPGQLDRFRYYLLPTVPPLDTPEGGRAVLDTLRRDGVQATVFDTIGRTLEGEENPADTINAYYRHTALHLKAEGIASARLDHTGHSNPDRARGSSGKGADVDVAWVLTRPEGSNISTLDHHGVTRVRWVPRLLVCTLVEGPPDRFERSGETWPAGTKECADLLDQYGVPYEYGRDKARQALTEAGEKATNVILSAAIRYRKQSNGRSLLDPKPVRGQVVATDPPNLSEDSSTDSPSDQGSDSSRTGADRSICPTTDRSHPQGGDRSVGPVPEPFDPELEW